MRQVCKDKLPRRSGAINPFKEISIEGIKVSLTLEFEYFFLQTNSIGNMSKTLKRGARLCRAEAASIREYGSNLTASAQENQLAPGRLTVEDEL